ncbi:MAG: SLC13 family permease [Oscillospiraceae bacterium]|nr:SLC13 family permease [Oscillospiraceae bacterium]
MTKTKDKSTLHIIIGIAIFLLMRIFIPATNGLTSIGVSVLSVFVATVYLWITIGTGWPSLLCILGMILTGVKTPAEIWAASFGSWLIPFLIFCFMFSIALTETGFMRRIITWFITRKFVENRPWAFITMLLVGEYILGLIMDCTAESVFVLPLCLELFEMLECKKEDKLVKVILIGSICSTILSTLATPIGHVIPVMYIGYALADHGAAVSLIKYTICALPACTVTLALMILYFKFIVRPDVSKLQNYNVEMARKNLPPKTKQETYVATAYFICIALWILPDLISGILPGVASYISGLGYAVAPGIALCIMCMVKVNGKPAMNYVDLFSKVNWNTIILVCCMNTLSSTITAASTGVSTWLGNVMSPLVASVSSGMVIVAIAAIWDIVQTNFMSCFATGAMVYAAIVPMCIAFPALGVSPAAMTLLIGMGCGFGALIPPASGPPSVLMSTDWCTPSDSFKITPPIIVIFILATIFLAYPLFSAMVAAL